MQKKSLIFLLLFVISFFISLFLNIENFDVPYFRGINNKVSVDIILNNETPFDIIETDSFKTIKIDNNHYLFEQKNYKKIKNIELKNIENIKKIIVYNGLKASFINKATNHIDINNQKSFLNQTAIIFLSFFYNFWYYIIPYIFLFFFFNSLRINTKVKYVVPFLLCLSLFLRIVQINDIPFWDDEIYVIANCASYSPLKNLFLDLGNPPLYYILFKIFKFFVKTPVLYRCLSVIIGVLFNYLIYIYLKEYTNKKIATIGLFVATINIILIYYSQELRSYILLMTLNILCAFYLFKFNSKNKIKYILSSIALICTHFYGIFLFFYNLIFASILFYKNKIKYKSFLLSQLPSFLIIILLLLLKFQAINSNFNSWIKIPNWSEFLLILKIFCPIILFILFIYLVFYVYQKTDKKMFKTIIAYNGLAMLSVFFFSLVFSYFVKSIFYYKYFYAVFPNYLILCSILICFEYRNKYKNVFSIILFLSLLMFQRVNYQNLFCNHNLYFDFIKNDIDYSKNNYIFVTDTIKDYKEFKIFNKAKMIYLPVNIGMNDIDIEKYVSKPSISYVLNLYLKPNIINQADNIELYKTPLGVFAKIEYK